MMDPFFDFSSSDTMTFDQATVDVIPPDPLADVPPSASAISDPAGTGADQAALGQQIVNDSIAGYQQEQLGQAIVQSTQNSFQSGVGYGILSATAGVLPSLSTALPRLLSSGTVNGASAVRTGSVGAKPVASITAQATTGEILTLGVGAIAIWWVLAKLG